MICDKCEKPMVLKEVFGEKIYQCECGNKVVPDELTEITDDNVLEESTHMK
ncbi:MAG: hypothetical protein P1Q69_07355 [Candidatus Thorarchaeota archaeon]|nr:hypothetical protein [Candidatus Thorarchaeota archaeon]